MVMAGEAYKEPNLIDGWNEEKEDSKEKTQSMMV